MKFIHLNYYYHKEFKGPQQVIDKHKLASGFTDHLKHQLDLVSVKHLDYEGETIMEGIRYRFFKSLNHSWYIPFKTHRFIEREQPDVVLVEGFVFPLQVLFLRLKLGKKCLIIAQHHAELPWSGLRGFLQKLADRSIDAYIFTSLGNALPWLKKKIISQSWKCHEVLSASTSFRPINKVEAKRQLNMNGALNFLWVGLLTARKDPMTILRAFKKFISIKPEAKLYMIYQSGELLPVINEFLSGNMELQQSVILVGKIEHEELPLWYSASDFYISGSHNEGSGYALVEAMSCGCVPVVTDIPSFRKITRDGRFGFLFERGNPESLFEKLKALPFLSQQNLSSDITGFAEKELSFEAISNQLLLLYNQLRYQ